MAKKSEKTVSQQSLKEDVIGSRLLALLAVSVAYIFILMFIYNAIVGVTNILAGFAAIKGMFIASIVLLVLAIVFFIIRKTKKTDETLRVITGSNVLATFIVFFVASALIYKFDVSAIKLMYVAVPVWFLIYMVYKLYMREFFTVSLSCVVGAVAVFCMYHLSSAASGVSGSLISALKPAEILFFIIIIVLAVLMCVMAVIAKKQGGYITKKKTIRIASASASYQPMFIAPILTVAALLASLANAQILFYSIFIIAAFWLVMFIHYTYNMIRK